MTNLSAARSSRSLPSEAPLQVGLAPLGPVSKTEAPRILSSAQRIMLARRLLDVEAPYQDRLARTHAARAEQLQHEGKPKEAARETALASTHRENAKTQRKAAATQLALEAASAERQASLTGNSRLKAQAASAHTGCAQALVETVDAKAETLPKEHVEAKQHLDRARDLDPQAATKPDYLAAEWRWAAVGKTIATGKPELRRTEIETTHVLLGNTVRRLNGASDAERPSLKAQAEGLSLELAEWRDQALVDKKGHEIPFALDAAKKRVSALVSAREQTLTELDALVEQGDDILGQAMRPFASDRAKEKAAAYQDRVRSLRAALDDLKVAAHDARETLGKLRDAAPDAVTRADRADITLGALTDFCSTQGKLPSAADLLAGGLSAARLSPANALDAIYLASAARLSRDAALAAEATRGATTPQARAIVGGAIAVLDPAAAMRLLSDAKLAIDALPSGPDKTAQSEVLRAAAVQATLSLANRPKQLGPNGEPDNATSAALAFATAVGAEDPALDDLRALPARLDRSLATADARVVALGERAKADTTWNELAATEAVESLVSVLTNVVPDSVLPSSGAREGVYKERLAQAQQSIDRADGAQREAIAATRATLKDAQLGGTFSLAIGNLMQGPLAEDALLGGYFGQPRLVANGFDAHLRAARFTNASQEAKLEQSAILLHDMYFDRDGTRSALMTYGPIGVAAGELIATTILGGLALKVPGVSQLGKAYAALAELLSPLGSVGSRVAQGLILMGAQQGVSAMGDQVWSRDAAGGRVFQLATASLGAGGVNQVAQLRSLMQSLALPSLQLAVEALVIPELSLSAQQQQTARLMLMLAIPVLAALHGHAREVAALREPPAPPAIGESPVAPPLGAKANIELGEHGKRAVWFTPDKDPAGNETYRMLIEVKNPEDAHAVFNELLARFKQQTGFDLLAITDKKLKFTTGAVEGAFLKAEPGPYGEKTVLRVHFKHALDGDVGEHMYKAIGRSVTRAE